MRKRSLKIADYAIKEIKGIGETYAPKFRAVGIKTVADLLEKGKSPKGREELAEATGISEKLILKWVDMSDLFGLKASARNIRSCWKRPASTRSRN